VKEGVFLGSALYFTYFSYSACAYQIRGHTEITLLDHCSKELDKLLFKSVQVVDCMLHVPDLSCSRTCVSLCHTCSLKRQHITYLQNYGNGYKPHHESIELMLLPNLENVL
jgi:hypothetical protein